MRPFGDYATRGDPVSKKSSPPSRPTSNCSGRRAACIPRSRYGCLYNFHLRYPRNPWFVCIFCVTNQQILRST
jgi:hypothetical protein